MSTKIWGVQETAVVAPGDGVTLEFEVSQGDGQPLTAAPARVDVSPAEIARAAPSSLATDAAGKVAITFQAGDQPGVAQFSVRVGDAEQEGRLYVTDVQVDLPQANDRLRNFSPEEELLLQMLYWNKKRLRILRQFGGGLSGSRVLQVQPEDERGAQLTQVVKIGPRDSMLGEKEAYRRHFHERLAHAAPVTGHAEHRAKAAIIYGDATAFQAFRAMLPLADFFLHESRERLRAALYAVLESGLRNVYRFCAIRRKSYRELLFGYLPENLVVALDKTASDSGVHAPEKIFLEETALPVLHPRDVQRQPLPVRPGDVVLLKGFTVRKVQEDDLNLDGDNYRVKVRYGGSAPRGVAWGDKVDVIGRVASDRNSRIAFAVQDCLKRHGAKARGGGWELGGEFYPDPIRLLDPILDAQCDVAWGSIHGDLHWENVVLADPDNWRLIDYGLTSEGPILFDFVKLETYLRYTELSKRSWKREEILDFEHRLVENPLGGAFDPPLPQSELRKATAAIHSIRRMALRYVVNDLFDYWRLLFGYALALTKYYPTKDQWERAEGDPEQPSRLEKAGHQMFHALALALPLGRLLTWDQKRRDAPRAPLEFTSDKNVAPQPGKIVLDTGSRGEPGVVDHHFSGGERDSTAALVLKHPQFVTDHLANVEPEVATWVLHEWPDFDAISSLYLAWHRLHLGFFPPGARQLAEYAVQVDAGAGFLDVAAAPERTPYALFVTQLEETRTIGVPPDERDRQAVQAGWKVLDYLIYLEAVGYHALANNGVPYEHPFWRSVDLDEDIFEEQDLPAAQHLQARVWVHGRAEEVRGLALTNPRSALFKAWARRRGWPLLVVLWPQPHKLRHRIVVSVPPTLGGALRGLGRALEEAESARRKEMNRPRPPEPKRWPDVDNADPWYDGRAPIHDYTIVDAPMEGTVLALAQVIDSLQQGHWLPSETLEAH